MHSTWKKKDERKNRSLDKSKQPLKYAKHFMNVGRKFHFLNEQNPCNRKLEFDKKKLPRLFKVQSQADLQVIDIPNCTPLPFAKLHLWICSLPQNPTNTGQAWKQHREPGQGVSLWHLELWSLTSPCFRVHPQWRVRNIPRSPWNLESELPLSAACCSVAAFEDVLVWLYHESSSKESKHRKGWIPNVKILAFSVDEKTQKEEIADMKKNGELVFEIFALQVIRRPWSEGQSERGEGSAKKKTGWGSEGQQKMSFEVDTTFLY